MTDFSTLFFRVVEFQEDDVMYYHLEIHGLVLPF